MQKVFEKLYEVLHYDIVAKFIKFGLVGASGMVLDYGVLILCKELLGLPALVANAISFTVAASSNYFLNRIWTFQSTDRDVALEYVKFFGVSLVGLAISTLTLWLLGMMLPEWNTDWRFYILKFGAIVVTTVWNFFGNMLFTFRKPANSMTSGSNTCRERPPFAKRKG